MFMRSKTFHLRCGITGIIPILTITLPGNISTFDMTGLGNKVSKSKSQNHELCLFLSNSLSIHSAKITIHWIPTIGSFVLVDFERVVSIFDVDFFFFHDEVGGYHRPGYFSTVCAVAEVTAWFCKELVVVDCYRDTAAEARAGQ